MVCMVAGSNQYRRCTSAMLLERYVEGDEKIGVAVLRRDADRRCPFAPQASTCHIRLVTCDLKSDVTRLYFPHY
jgi:hypothetical protein